MKNIQNKRAGSMLDLKVESRSVTVKRFPPLGTLNCINSNMTFNKEGRNHTALRVCTKQRV